MTIPDAMAIATQQHRAGRLAEAEAIYRQVLALQPGHAEALHLLGLVACQAGHNDAGVDLIRRAIAASPATAEYHNNLGIALRRQGRPDEAIAAHRLALQLQPDYPEGHGNLGTALYDLGRMDEAIACYRRAIQLKPDYAECHYNLGNALNVQGSLDGAVSAFRRAIQLRPDYASALNNLGNVLGRQRNLDDAVAAYHRAIQINPGFAEAYNNLGNALNAGGKLDEASLAYERAIEIQPGLSEARINLGNALSTGGRLAEARLAFEQAIEIQPDFSEARINLGSLLAGEGRIGEAIAQCRRAVELKPDFAGGHSNLLFNLQYLPDLDTRELVREHRRWNDIHAAPLGKFIARHDNDPSPLRRLRIGYVSADFRDHVVGNALLPCFAVHDRERFDLICYSGTAPSDPIGERFRNLGTEWRETAAMSDEELASKIREDRIDILVDLSLHTAGNRLLAFARKPAPVQIAWLGYPGATGLSAMDYRITDAHLDPPGLDALAPLDPPLRLPDCWCCYGAPEDSPMPGELPAVRNGCVTFGSFNNLAKSNPRVLALSAAILKRIEGSRLLLLSKGGGIGHIAEFFQERGIAQGRVQFLDYYPASPAHSGGREPPAYLRRYEQIDIALDPFPYNGMTTTCDALWMGVPVVALIGDTPISRASFSLLSNAGLPELAATSEEQYAEIATNLARDLPRLASLRATLREKMKASPLLDATQFAKNLEAAFRNVWERWCAKQSTLQTP